MNRKRFDYYCQNLPSPIAIPLMKAVTAIEPSEKCRKLGLTIEALTRYISAIAFAEYFSLPADKHTDAHITQSGITMKNGTALDRSTHIFRYLSRKSEIFSVDIVEWFFLKKKISNQVQDLYKLITLRNNYTHEVPPPDFLDDFIDSLCTFFDESTWLFDFRLFVVLQQNPMEPKGANGCIRWLMGTGGALDIQEVRWKTRLYTEEIYLVNPSCDAFLRLYPFLDWATDETRFEKGVFLWTQIKRKSIYYLSVRSPATRNELIAYQNLLLPWQEFLNNRPTNCRILLNDIESEFLQIDEEEDIFIEEASQDEIEKTFSLRWILVVVLISLITIVIRGYPTRDEPQTVIEVQPIQTTNLIPVSISFDPALPTDAVVLINGLQVELENGLFSKKMPPQTPVSLSLIIAKQECTFQDESISIPLSVDIHKVTASWSCPGIFRYSTIDVEGSYFWMGAPKSMLEAEKDEKYHQVTLDYSYAVGTTEVTQKLWEELTGDQPSTFSNCPLCPVESITWYEAIEFANLLSQKEYLETCYTIIAEEVSFSGLSCNGWRLPTEAEWEFAARGGKRFIYSGSQNPVTVAHFLKNSTLKDEARTIPVGGLKANNLGLYDMSGNVYEWCWDWYGDYDNAGDANPTGPTYGEKKVGRGGGYLSDDLGLRVMNRASTSPTLATPFIGLRLVRTLSK
jgi:formylglycine-generating enzyme